MPVLKETAVATVAWRFDCQAIGLCQFDMYPSIVKSQEAVRLPREPWNKGRLCGQKRPLKLQEIWSIRIRLQLRSVPVTWPCSISPRVAGYNPELESYNERLAGLSNSRLPGKHASPLNTGLGRPIFGRRISYSRAGLLKRTTCLLGSTPA